MNVKIYNFPLKLYSNLFLKVQQNGKRRYSACNMFANLLPVGSIVFQHVIMTPFHYYSPAIIVTLLQPLGLELDMRRHSFGVPLGSYE